MDYAKYIIDGRQGRFVRAYVSTLGQVFNHVYVAPIGGDLGTVARHRICVRYTTFAEFGSRDFSIAGLLQTHD